MKRRTEELDEQQASQLKAALASLESLPPPPLGKWGSFYPPPAPSRFVEPEELSDDDRRQIAAAFADGERRRAFWEKNYRRLAELYPEQYIVVVNGVVVASDPDFSCAASVLESLDRKSQDVYFKYMTLRPQTLLL